MFTGHTILGQFGEKKTERKWKKIKPSTEAPKPSVCYSMDKIAYTVFKKIFFIDWLVVVCRYKQGLLMSKKN